MVKNERNVRELRRLGPECAIEFNMFGRVREMIFTADDMRNLHFHVVHDVDEMKNPRTVWTPQCHVRMRAGIG